NFKFRVSPAHHFNHEISYLIEESAFEAQSVTTLVDRAAHDLTKHIVAAFIAGKNSVGDQKCGCACVVGNHAHRETFRRFRLIIFTTERGGEINEGANQIRVVI